MENRNGLAVDAELTRAAGSAERLAALAMAEAFPAGHKTLGADKGYDTHDFVMEAREFGITPHVAQNAYETATAQRRYLRPCRLQPDPHAETVGGKRMTGLPKPIRCHNQPTMPLGKCPATGQPHHRQRCTRLTTAYFRSLLPARCPLPCSGSFCNSAGKSEKGHTIMPIHIGQYDQYYLALIVVIGTIPAVIFLLWLTQRSRYAKSIHSYRGIVPNFLSVMGVLFALNLAFLANDTWSAHDRARHAVFQEAGSLRSILGGSHGANARHGQRPLDTPSCGTLRGRTRHNGRALPITATSFWLCPATWVRSTGCSPSWNRGAPAACWRSTT